MRRHCRKNGWFGETGAPSGTTPSTTTATAAASPAAEAETAETNAADAAIIPTGPGKRKAGMVLRSGRKRVKLDSSEEDVKKSKEASVTISYYFYNALIQYHPSGPSSHQAAPQTRKPFIPGHRSALYTTDYIGNAVIHHQMLTGRLASTRRTLFIFQNLYGRLPPRLLKAPVLTTR